MPDAAFFSRFNVFSQKSFLDEKLCAVLRVEATSSSFEEAGIVRGTQERIDDQIRKTKIAKVSAETAALVKNRLLELKPTLESFFQTTLSGFQKLDFLLYKTGDYFILHRDSGDNPEEPDYVKERLISLVIFLNGEAKEPSAENYCGGEFYFYGLIDDRRAKNLGFHLHAEQGLLIAFRSEILHEVKPVTSGHRHTIVTWFY